METPIGDVTSQAFGSGARANTGKMRLDLIPTELLRSTAMAFEYGAKKYAAWNWAKGMPLSVPIACMKRHIAALERGEDHDEESGCRHIGHVICNALMIEHYQNMIQYYPETAEFLDDRPFWFNYTGHALEAELASRPKVEPRVSHG